jgi:hypothetical protein
MALSKRIQRSIILYLHQEMHIGTVEMMDVETLVWSTAASLPHPYSMYVC